MHRLVLLATALLGCAGHSTPVTTPPTSRLKPPAPGQHLAHYLGIRQRVTGVVPQVMVCPGVAIADGPTLERVLQTAGTAGFVRLAAPADCEQQLRRPSTGDAVIVVVHSITITGGDLVLTAWTHPSTRAPWCGRERFVHLEFATVLPPATRLQFDGYCPVD